MMKNLIRLLVAVIITLWMTVFSSPLYATLCQSQLTNKVTDYVAQQLILELLIEVQKIFLKRSIADSGTEKSGLPLLQKFLDVTLAAQQKASMNHSEHLCSVFLDKINVTLIDPRASKVKLAKERGLVVATECPRYKLLTRPNCGKRKHLDLHNLFTFYLRNVHGICGEAIIWEPLQRRGPVKTLFEQLSSKERFAKLYKFHEQPANGEFRERNNFFTLFYLDFLAESIRVKEPDLVYREFLGVREDIIKKYPNLRYLQRLLRYLMNEGGL